MSFFNADKFVLGAAQFGLNYGIANRTGKPNKKALRSIIEMAWKHGIHEYDTAKAYGNAEEKLGSCFDSLGIQSQVKIISKLGSPYHSKSIQLIIRSIKESVRRLRINRLYGLLMHDPTMLDQWNVKFKNLFQILKAEGLTENSGVSIYKEDEFEKAIRIPEVDIIQLPFNIFDQRALQNGWFLQAKKLNKQIYIRSIYLQGLLVMDPDKLPKRVLFVKNLLDRYGNFCRINQLSQKEMALGFVLRYSGGAKIIMGIDCSDQLSENLSLIEKLQGLSFFSDSNFNSQAVSDYKVINPSLWDIN